MKIPKAFKQFNNEYHKERKEHPKLPAWVVRQIVQDHMKKMK